MDRVLDGYRFSIDTASVLSVYECRATSLEASLVCSSTVMEILVKTEVGKQ